MGLIKGSQTGDTTIGQANVEYFSSAEGRKVTEEHGIPAISPLIDQGFIPKHIPINKDKRILWQGITQACIESQGLLLEPGGTWEDKVENATIRFVKFVEENSK